MATKTDHKLVLSAQDKTKAALGSVQKSFGRVKSAVFSLQSAMAVLVGGAGFGALAVSAVKTVDSLAKVSQKLGITTEALAGLRFAGDISGVSIQTMDMALQRFTRRVAEAAIGTGEAKGALQELNLDAAKLVKLPLETQMMIIADAFEGVGTQADRVRLAMKLFDSEGVALVNTLDGGSESLRTMMSEAASLGLTIDSTRAGAVERFQDSLTKLRAAIDGAFIQAIGDSAPLLEDIAVKVQNLLVPAIRNLISGFNWFLENLDIITKAFRFFLITLAVNKLITFTLGLIQISKQLFVLAFAARTSGKALLRGLAGPIVAIGIAIADATGAIDALLEKMGLGGLTTIAPEAAQALEEANEAAKKLGEGVNYELVIPLENARDGLTKMKASAKTMANVFEDNLARGMESATDALTDFMMGTLKAGDAFKQFANGIIRDLIRMQIQQNITKPLFGMIQGFMGGANPIMAGRTQSGFVQAGGAFANGGMMPGGKASIVGERGPELVIPNRNSTVVSNEQLQGLGGGAVNVTLNISTGVAQTVRTEIASLMPQIAAATKQAVVDARRRGGSFASAFGG